MQTFDILSNAKLGSEAYTAPTAALRCSLPHPAGEFPRNAPPEIVMKIKSKLFKSLTILILSATLTFNAFAQSKKLNTSLSAMNLAKQMECGWNPQPKSCKECKADVQLLNELNQLILDTIRASGGNNANRFVMIPGMGTSISTALADYFVLPKDSAKDKLLVTVHLYPLDAGGTRHGSHHFDSQTKNEIIKSFRLLDAKFSSKGIPVVLGECGASRIGGLVWEGNVQKEITDYIVTYKDRLDCFSFLASQTGKYTMPLLWQMSQS